MIRWIFLTITAIVFLITAWVVLWVRRREQAKQVLSLIPDFEVQHPNSTIEGSEVQIVPEELIDNNIITEPLLSANTFEIISISVLANPNHTFGGYELLQSLLSNNLRYGKYQIFHYHELDKILFSLASATKPGTFDLDAMGGYDTKGLTLFMELNNEPNLEAILEKMFQVANNIARDLGGYLVDNHREPLSDSSMHALRTRIRSHNRALEVHHEYTV